MLGLNDQGQMIEIKDIDPLTGTRSLETLNNASALRNVVISNEVNLAKEQQADDYARGLEYTRAQAKANQRQREINKKNQELELYNRQVLLYQHANQMQENINKAKDTLSLERAVRDFKRQPSDVSQIMDGGFKTVEARGRAHAAPVSDYEKVLQREAFGVNVVAIDHNPLGSMDFNQGQIIDADEYLHDMARSCGNKLRFVADDSSIRSVKDFANDQKLGDAFSEFEAMPADFIPELVETTTQPEATSDGGGFWSSLFNSAEKAIASNQDALVSKALQQAAGIAPRPATSSTTTVVKAALPPGAFLPTTTMSLQNQKYLKYGAIGLGGLAVALLLIKAVKK